MIMEIKHRSTGINSEYHEAKAALEKNRIKGRCLICGHDLPKGQRKYCTRDCFLGWFQQFNPPFIWGEFREKVFKRDHYTCVKCHKTEKGLEAWYRGTKYGYGAMLIADHIQPIALGGPEFDMKNVQTLCLGCNRTKTREDARKIAKLRSDIKMGRVHNNHRWPLDK